MGVIDALSKFSHISFPEQQPLRGAQIGEYDFNSPSQEEKLNADCRCVEEYSGFKTGFSLWGIILISTK